jgi:hypothetical protein
MKMQMDREAALQRALALKEHSCLDAAYAALDGAASKNDQVSELAGFLFDSNDYAALKNICANLQVDQEQAREWKVTDAEYCLAHEIALLARRVERIREGLPAD